MLQAANLKHTNLQFTIETPNTNGNLAFLDLQISIDKAGKLAVGGIINQQIQVPY